MEQGKKIILIGYMGSGKSAISKVLSEKLQINHIDLDTFIEREEKDTIADIFRKKGEIYFRKKETIHLKTLVNAPERIIIALGGGTPCFGENMKTITKNTNCKSFYLKARPQTLFERLKTEKKQRPLIRDIATQELKAFISKHLFERIPFYQKANYHIEVDNVSIEKISLKIIEKLP